MKEKIKILYWLYKSKINNKGLAPIYLRLSKNKERTEISTGLTVQPKQWNSSKGRVKGNSPDIQELNGILEGLQAKIFRIQSQAINNQSDFTLMEVKRQLNPAIEKGFIHYFDLHLERMETLIGKDYAQGSLDLYQKTRDDFQEYLILVNGKGEVNLTKLNYSLIEGFGDYLRTAKNNTTNTVLKKIQRINRIVNDLVRKDIISKNPFHAYRLKKEVKEIVYLNGTELALIENKQIDIKRLELVKDLFVFSCYTSLAYKEVVNLSKEHLITDDAGIHWIVIKRQKTDRAQSVPILPKAQQLISKYKEDKNSKIFPSISNQKLNAYLKEIGDICGIKKNLTFHVSRKTFATTITLTRGISLDSVSKMLGHSSVAVTSSHYAVVTNQKILDEMETMLKE